MGQKIFLEKHQTTLVSDERDIMVSADYYFDVLEWCWENHIKVEAPGCNYTHDIAKKMFNVHLWRIRDEQQRMWFSLRWA